MQQDLKSLSDSELEVMQIIWDHEPPVSRSTVEEVLCQERSLAPSTIITFLTRLCDKGYLTLEKKGRMNLYTPLMSHEGYLAQESRSFLDKLCGGSVSKLAVALSGSGISKEDLQELKKLLEDDDL